MVYELGYPKPDFQVFYGCSQGNLHPTNAIESLKSTYRRLNRQRSVFPSDTALLKAIYLATFEATKKWTMALRNWGKVYGELSIMYEGRLQQ
ncbi:transposase [Ruminiclostridium josui]|uniref:transposase n=1 Tax=Ruminiclostridium josui TaxID=1499 RepID=UPI00241833E4|nr:transposase [Ruminiclostridium josui]